MDPEISSALIALVGVLASALISYWISRKVYVSNQIFDVKKEALLSALAVLDDYLSWLEFVGPDGSRSPDAMRRNISSLELTVAARECYNKLCVTCDNRQILTSFLEIIFGDPKSVCEEYDKFRSAVRDELHLCKFKFDSNRSFLSIVSTCQLLKVSAHGKNKL